MLTTASEKIIEELGIGRHPPSQHVDEWDTLQDAWLTTSGPPTEGPMGIVDLSKNMTE